MWVRISRRPLLKREKRMGEKERGGGGGGGGGGAVREEEVSNKY